MDSDFFNSITFKYTDCTNIVMAVLIFVVWYTTAERCWACRDNSMSAIMLRHAQKVKRVQADMHSQAGAL